MDKDANEHLHWQLIKLGDMMGDGLHLEPGGRWISQDYKKVAQALGHIPKRNSAPRNTEHINQRMIQRVNTVKCQHCHGDLKQTRSGSKRARCLSCGSKWQLLK